MHFRPRQSLPFLGTEGGAVLDGEKPRGHGLKRRADWGQVRGFLPPPQTPAKLKLPVLELLPAAWCTET